MERQRGYSLWKLRIVEGGLQDASRKNCETHLKKGDMRELQVFRNLLGQNPTRI